MDRSALGKIVRQLRDQANTIEKMLEATEQPSLLEEPRKAPEPAVINVFGGHHILTNLLMAVPIKAQQSWVEAYPSVPWLKEEMLKAHSWVQCNPHKAPKNIMRFLSTWFLKAHENYRKGLPSSQLRPTVYRGPTGGLPEDKPHPGGKPLNPELKKALNVALKRPEIE
jgi:hypothetical protein